MRLVFYDNPYDGTNCTAFNPNHENFNLAAGTSLAPDADWHDPAHYVALNTWYCVVGTYANDSLKLYIDGALVKALHTPGGISPSSDDLFFGCHMGGVNSFPYWFNGVLDDLRFYNRALSASEAAMYCDSSRLLPTPPTPPTPVQPTGSLNNPTFCPGEEGFLAFNATAGTAPYTLTITNGTDTFSVPGVYSGVPFSVGTITGTTTYTVLSIADAAGGLNTAPGISATLSVYPPAFAEAGPNKTLCGPDTLTLQGSGNGTFLWSPAASLSNATISNPLATVDTTTTYVLQVTTPDGCIATDAVYINVVQPGSFAVDTAAYICPGDSVQLFATGGDTYLWLPDTTGLSNPNIPNPWATPATDRTYRVVITSTFCDVRDTLSVRVSHHGFPTITAAKSNDLDCGQTFSQLAAGGALSYVWTPAINLETPTAATTFARPDTTTTYTVLGTDQFGCTGRTTITLEVRQDGDSRVQAPSAFTPNADGVNDCWKLFLPGYTSEFQLLVFNRWGQQVFSTMDADKCWDGYFNGVLQPIGTYVYYYKGKNSYCGKIEGKGNFHLLR